MTCFLLKANLNRGFQFFATNIEAWKYALLMAELQEEISVKDIESLSIFLGIVGKIELLDKSTFTLWLYHCHS
jgi:hypothetical protein